MAGWSLAQRGISMEPAPQVGARAIGTAWLGLSLGILLTLLRGPDGQKILYDTLLVVQICTFLMLWHSHIIEGWSQHIVGCHNRFNNHCHTNFCIRPG